MSEFNYLTGRKELFDNAPSEAMVVLEDRDGSIYYAVSHNRGAQYWYDNGNPGRPIGLIALFEKTRVIASRVRVDGLPPVQPKRDQIPKSRLDRMQQAQESLKKVVSQPVPVTPKPERKPEPAPVKAETPKFTPKSDQRLMENTTIDQAAAEKLKAIKPVEWSKPDAGFVSILGLSKRGGSIGKDTFVTSTISGNVKLSSSMPLVVGDRVDAQIDPASGRFRIGKVSSGGYVLTKSRCLTSKALFDMLKKPDGAKSVRIFLTEVDGWWQGQAELVGVTK